MDREERINQLLKERDELLRNHPELRKMQMEIDQVLANVGSNPHRRARALHLILQEYVRTCFLPAMSSMIQLLQSLRTLNSKSMNKIKELIH